MERPYIAECNYNLPVLICLIKNPDSYLNPDNYLNLDSYLNPDSVSNAVRVNEICFTIRCPADDHMWRK